MGEIWVSSSGHWCWLHTTLEDSRTTRKTAPESCFSSQLKHTREIGMNGAEFCVLFSGYWRCLHMTLRSRTTRERIQFFLDTVIVYIPCPDLHTPRETSYPFQLKHACLMTPFGKFVVYIILISHQRASGVLGESQW